MQNQDKISSNLNYFSRKNRLVILVNLEIIEQSIVNCFDDQKHILLQKKDQNIYVVLKNKKKLLVFFDYLQKIKRQFDQHINKVLLLHIVSYSSKPVEVIYQKLAKINKFIADNMCYFNILPKCYPTVRPNRAFLIKHTEKNVNLITYGEGYSQIKTKEELRLAVQSVFNLVQQNDRIFIIETEKGLKQDEKQLRKQGYNNLWSINDFQQQQSTNSQKQSIEQAVKRILHEQESQTMTNQTSSNCSYYLNKLSKKLKPEQYNQIVSNIQTSHFLNQTLYDNKSHLLSSHKIMHQFLSTPKKSFTPTPKSTLRSQNSKQICSLIFKNVSDHKLYVAKSSLSKDIGGLYYEQKVEQRCFMSIIPNLFANIENSHDSSTKQERNIKYEQQFYSLPFEKSYSMMKYSLLKPYDTKKACVLVKPYLQNLVCLQRYAGEFLQFVRMQDSPIRGFGSAIFWALLSGQSFKTKTFLQQLSLLISQEQTIYLTNNCSSLKQFVSCCSETKNKKVSMLRVDYFEPFSSNSQFNSFFSFQSDDLKIPLTRTISIDIKELSINYLTQIDKLATLIVGDGVQNKLMQIQKRYTIGLQMIKGFCAHYKWEHDKMEIVDSFYNKALRIKLYVQQIIESKFKSKMQNQPKENLFSINYKDISKNFISNMQQSSPLLFLLFISKDYARFIKPPEPQQNYFTQFYQKTNEIKQNQYVINLVQKTHSFQIYGNCPPIYSLPNWVRSLSLKYRFIEYISMLTHTKEDFILISKRMKIQATNEKNNALLIVDHCELCEQLLNQAKSVRTIFLSRFKKGEHEMQVINEQQVSQSSKQTNYLSESNDELILSLLQFYEKHLMENYQQQFLFKKYQFVLDNYIKIKCQQYNFSYEKARQFCYELHKNISQGKNRFKEIQQKFKTNNEWKLLYVLPVQKRNQKVTFVKNLHSFIDLQKFIEQILKEKIYLKQKSKKQQMSNSDQSIQSKYKMMKINPKLLVSLRQWLIFIETEIKKDVIDYLISLVRPLTVMPIQEYLRTQTEIDDFNLVMQVLQSFLLPYKDWNSSLFDSKKQGQIWMLKNEQLFRKWSKLYFNLFPQQLGVYHFPQLEIIKIRRHKYKSNILVAETSQGKELVYEIDFLSQKLVKVRQTQKQIVLKSKEDDHSELEQSINKLTNNQSLRMKIEEKLNDIEYCGNDKQKYVKVVYCVDLDPSISQEVYQNQLTSRSNDSKKIKATVYYGLLVKKDKKESDMKDDKNEMPSTQKESFRYQQNQLSYEHQVINSLEMTLLIQKQQVAPISIPISQSPIQIRLLHYLGIDRQKLVSILPIFSNQHQKYPQFIITLSKSLSTSINFNQISNQSEEIKEKNIKIKYDSCIRLWKVSYPKII